MRKIHKMILFFVCLSASCGGNGGEYIEPLKGKALYLFAKDASSASLRFGKTVRDLKETDFPLSLFVYNAIPSAEPFEKQAFQFTEIPFKSIGYPVSLRSIPQEGKITLLKKNGETVDELYYWELPSNAILVRETTEESFCEKTTWLSLGICNNIPRANKPKRLRTLRSRADFESLASLSGEVGFQSYSLKFIVDLARQDSPHFFSAHWDLHYRFFRDQIEKGSWLDRCVPEENYEFNRGWTEFSYYNYTLIQERRFLLGNLMFYPGAKVFTLEFASGDTIIGSQMKKAYDTLLKYIPPSFQVKIRPINERQKEELQKLAKPPQWIQESSVYQEEKIQLLSPGESYGILKIVSSSELPKTTLGLRTIVLLKDVPNDVAFVGGIISTQFQSALSHINVLSRNRGTPHLVLKDALQREDIQSMNGKLVRLVVTEKDYVLELATLEKATKFWGNKEGGRVTFEPKLDTSRKEIFELQNSSLEDLPFIGAKAANMAELSKVTLVLAGHEICKTLKLGEKLELPSQPFAIPFYWYVQHIQEAQIASTIEALHQEEKFRKEEGYRSEKLKEIREKILTTAVNKELLELVKKTITERYGKDISVRFRSSTNVEDLENFSGAGLYTSKSGKIGDPNKSIEDAIRKVWASLWEERAWSEREYYKINHTKAAMALLCHPSFPDEKANGVAVSTNIFDPIGPHASFVAVQKGEVSVVNPEDHSTADQFLIRWWTNPEILFISRSSLTQGKAVLTTEQSLVLGCSVRAIHSYFSSLYQKEGKPYAMDIEFKLDTTSQSPTEPVVIIKQARPYIFGEVTSKNACKDK